MESRSPSVGGLVALGFRYLERMRAWEGKMEMVGIGALRSATAVAKVEAVKR